MNDNTITMDYDFRNDASLSDKWKFRFDFFQRYGMPGLMKPSAEYTAAFKQLSTGDRIKVMFNFFMAFFSVLYLLALGLWRQVVVVLAIGFGLGVVARMFNLSDSVLNSLLMGLQMALATRVNLMYYRKKVLGYEGWSL